MSGVEIRVDALLTCIYFEGVTDVIERGKCTVGNERVTNGVKKKKSTNDMQASSITNGLTKKKAVDDMYGCLEFISGPIYVVISQLSASNENWACTLHVTSLRGIKSLARKKKNRSCFMFRLQLFWCYNVISMLHNAWMFSLCQGKN
jgi:hypothetical protein